MTTDLHPPRKPLQKLYDRLAKISKRECGDLDLRLAQLEREWSVGQLVKATTAVLLLVGVSLMVWIHVWWIILIALTGIVLLQYRFGQRSWLGELFTYCGFRSGAQIEADRTALKVLRGDYPE